MFGRKPKSVEQTGDDALSGGFLSQASAHDEDGSGVRVLTAEGSDIQIGDNGRIRGGKKKARELDRADRVEATPRQGRRRRRQREVSLRDKGKRVVVWMMIGRVSETAIRIVNNVVLTRLLSPEIFGIMQMVHVVQQGIGMFSDVGIKPSVVRSPRGDDPAFLATAYSMQALRGLWLWLACCLVAFPVSWIYGQPSMAYLLPVTGMGALMVGLYSTSLMLRTRHMQAGVMETVSLVARVLAAIVTVALAWFWHSPWVLVIGGLSDVLFTLIGSHLIKRGKWDYFAWDAQAVKEIFTYGQWIFWTTVLTFFSQQADRLMLGKLLTLQELGVYGVAVGILVSLRSALVNFGTKVVMPIVAKKQEMPREQLRQLLEKNRLPVMIKAALLIALLAAFGDYAMRIVFPYKFWDASWMFTGLILGFWFRVILTVSSPALNAIGFPKYNMWGSVWRLLAVVIGLPLCHQWGGLYGVIVLMTLADCFNYLSISRGMSIHGLSCCRQDLLATLVLVGTLAPLLVIRHALGL